MLRSKTVRASQFRAYRSPNPKEREGDEHWIDIWLPRLSHFAQFGLFLFTLAISYFTVLPLYQKAVLEEAIAKKEVELGALNKSLESIYGKIRTYVMRDFYMTSIRCTGLLGRSTMKQSEIRATFEEEILSRDVPACLLEIAQASVEIKDLTEKDQQTFYAALKKMSDELVARRNQLHTDYQLVSKKIPDSDIDNLPRDSHTVQAQENIERWSGGTRDMAARRKIAEDLARKKIADEYLRLIRDGVHSLEKIEW